LLFFVTGNLIAETAKQAARESAKTEAQLKFEEKDREAEEIQYKEDKAAKSRREVIAQDKADAEELIAQLDMPKDTSPELKVRELRISGNTVVSTEELLEEIPFVYNAVGGPLAEAESDHLYDFRTIRDIIENPGKPREVSTRTIQGLTQCILTIYQDKKYAGIYVYVPVEALKNNKRLQDGVLPIRILEATVTNISITHYNSDNEIVEKGYLRDSAVRNWSSVKSGDIINRKKLDDFVNLLNLNPDRYVSAVVSKGTEPNSLALEYNLYEANPWHYFFQIDNSGTNDRQWTPRLGLINTNLLGIDDTLTVMYQAPWDKKIDENYSVYGSYDFPLFNPRLRLNLFGGYNEFDISGGGDVDFLGRGQFYGATLRYNAFQVNKWFFDVTGTLTHEESKVSPFMRQFPGLLNSLGADIKMDLWGIGVDVHHRDDMSDTSLTFNRFEKFSASDPEDFTLARTGADRDFTIYTTTAMHSQYLDEDKIQRASGSFRWVTTDERLVPAKMTSFGGMYSVRGYDEYEIVGDGGILASAQYEFDLVAYENSLDIYKIETEQTDKKKPFLRKLAPLAFVDYGLAKIEDPLTNEDKDQELCSVGGGLLTELGDNFSGVLYYGYPLISTDRTRPGKGRMNVGIMMRW
jgi:hemolysin activation/secretion protein